MRGAVRTRSAVEQIIERTSPWLLRRHPFLGATFSSSPSDDDEGPSTSFKPDQTERRRRKGHPSIDPLTPPPPASEFPPYEPRDFFRYELIHQSKKSAARVGRIHTPHGVIETPGFVAVGTNGALKAVLHQELAAAGVDLMFANTYHLMLQPGPDLVASAGGLHEFIGRDAPIITDSGGFQVFSLATKRRGRAGDEVAPGDETKRRGRAAHPEQ